MVRPRSTARADCAAAHSGGKRRRPPAPGRARAARPSGRGRPRGDRRRAPRHTRSRSVAGVALAELGPVHDALAAAGLLRPDGEGIAHSLISTAIKDDLSSADRERLHRESAPALIELGAASEVVASHLLECRPQGDADIGDWLERAGPTPPSGARPSPRPPTSSERSMSALRSRIAVACRPTSRRPRSTPGSPTHARDCEPRSARPETEAAESTCYASRRVRRHLRRRRGRREAAHPRNYPTLFGPAPWLRRAPTAGLDRAAEVPSIAPPPPAYRSCTSVLAMALAAIDAPRRRSREACARALERRPAGATRAAITGVAVSCDAAQPARRAIAALGALAGRADARVAPSAQPHAPVAPATPSRGGDALEHRRRSAPSARAGWRGEGDFERACTRHASRMPARRDGQRGAARTRPCTELALDAPRSRSPTSAAATRPRRWPRSICHLPNASAHRLRSPGPCWRAPYPSAATRRASRSAGGRWRSLGGEPRRRRARVGPSEARAGEHAGEVGRRIEARGASPPRACRLPMRSGPRGSPSARAASSSPPAAPAPRGARGRVRADPTPAPDHRAGGRRRSPTGLIAQQLFLSIKTVETHLAAGYRKLGVSTRTGSERSGRGRVAALDPAGRISGRLASDTR